MKNVRSNQPCISMNFCTEFSKAQVLPCEYCQASFITVDIACFLWYFLKQRQAMDVMNVESIVQRVLE